MLRKLNNMKSALIVLGVCILILVCVILVLGRNKKNEVYDGEAYTEQIFNTYDVDTIDIKVKKSSVNLADKYKLDNKNVEESVNEFSFGDIVGKAIYVRSKDLDLNVFRSVYEIKDDEDSIPLQQVREYMDKFSEEFYSITGVNLNSEPVEEKLYGESKYKFKMPIEESIYAENRLYSVTYKVANDLYTEGEKIEQVDKEIIYDLNYYMDGDNLVCELVRHF